MMQTSWITHHHGNSHTCWILKMDTSYLGCKSGKQRVGSPSSTDEIIAIDTNDGKVLFDPNVSKIQTLSKIIQSK